MFTSSDAALIRKALRGDQKAWTRLIGRYQSKLYNYALRMTGNQQDACDLLQEVHLAVFRSLSSFEGQATFQSWLFGIANFKVIEFYRRRRPTESLDENVDIRTSDAEDPLGQLGVKRQNTQIIRAMSRLPVNQRLIVELKYFSQFTFAQIAEQLMESENTIKSRFYSALSKLKTELQES